MDTKLLLAALVVGGAVLIFRLRSSGTISAGEATELVFSGATLVDVRSTEEFGSGHIEGAVNIPLASINVTVQGGA